MVRRRQFLVAVGVITFTGSAGCLDAESEFLVTNTQQVPSGDDLQYQVTIENTGPERQTGHLDLRLTHESTQEWEQTDEISLGRGASVRETYVFEDVLVDREPPEFSFDAALIPTDE